MYSKCIILYHCCNNCELLYTDSGLLPCQIGLHIIKGICFGIFVHDNNRKIVSRNQIKRKQQVKNTVSKSRHSQIHSVGDWTWGQLWLLAEYQIYSGNINTVINI